MWRIVPHNLDLALKLTHLQPVLQQIVDTVWHPTHFAMQPRRNYYMNPVTEKSDRISITYFHGMKPSRNLYDTIIGPYQFLTKFDDCGTNSPIVFGRPRPLSPPVPSPQLPHPTKPVSSANKTSASLRYLPSYLPAIR